MRPVPCLGPAHATTSVSLKSTEPNINNSHSTIVLYSNFMTIAKCYNSLIVLDIAVHASLCPKKIQEDNHEKVNEKCGCMQID